MNFWKPWEAHLKFSSICSYQALYCKRNPKFIWRFKNFLKECTVPTVSPLPRMLLFSYAAHAINFDADAFIFRCRSFCQFGCWYYYFQMKIMLATLMLMLIFSDADHASNFGADAFIFRCRLCGQLWYWCYYFQMQIMLAVWMLMLLFSDADHAGNFDADAIFLLCYQ